MQPYTVVESSKAKKGAKDVSPAFVDILSLNKPRGRHSIVITTKASVDKTRMSNFSIKTRREQARQPSRQMT